MVSIHLIAGALLLHLHSALDADLHSNARFSSEQFYRTHSIRMVDVSSRTAEQTTSTMAQIINTWKSLHRLTQTMHKQPQNMINEYINRKRTRKYSVACGHLLCVCEPVSLRSERVIKYHTAHNSFGEISPV